MSRALAGLAIGVLFGGVPLSWLVHRIAHGSDLRKVGSGNPGATNAWRQGGPATGLLALAGDVAKGAAAVALARSFGGVGPAAAAAFGAPLGHALTPWLAFRGGKGVAPALGAFAVLTPAAAGSAVAVFLAGVATTRWVSFGSVAGALALFGATLALAAPPPVVAAAAATACLLAWRHRANFARMRAGVEPRVGRRLGRGTDE